MSAFYIRARDKYRPRSVQRRWGSSAKPGALDDDGFISVKPIKRVQSAPRKLKYLNDSAFIDAVNTSNRPQTAAPRVREFTENTILDSTAQLDDVPLSNRRTEFDQSSDKQDQSSHGLKCEAKNGKSSNSKETLSTGISENNVSCSGEASKSEYKMDGVNGDIDNYKVACVTNERQDETNAKRKSVTFADTLLSETKYVLGKQSIGSKRGSSSTHEQLIDKLRQSFGIYIDDDKPTESVNVPRRFDVIYRNKTVPNDKNIVAENLTDVLEDVFLPIEKPISQARSSARRILIKKDGRDQGVWVKHLQGRRSRSVIRRKLEPVVEIEQKLILTEVKTPRRKVKGLFLRTMTFVWYVCRLLGCMIDLSSAMTARSATEEQWHALHTSKEARAMAFNKAAFMKRRDVNKVPNWAKKVMRKGPEDRTDTEVKRIHALLRGMKSFDRFTEKIQLSMCKSFVYYSINSGRVILRQGHVGQNFYFIFNGSVFVNLDDIDVRGNKFSKTEAILGRGDSFGELALLQDIRRTATITCREDCEMLVVDKDTFARICPRIFEMELEEKMRFVSQMKLFNLRIWHEESLRKMCFEAQIQEYKTNKVVVIDSEKDDWIYICMEGKCQVIRTLDIMEEIEWRKLNQQFSKSGTDRRASRPDYLTVMTGLSNLNYGQKDGSSRRRSVNPAVKQNLLDSMGLEFLQNRRLSCEEWNLLMDLKLQQRKVRRASRGDITSSLSHRGEYGPLTLTSLLANNEKQNGNHLFLDIHTMKQFDVFDLSSVLKSREEMDQSAGSHILVSLGARLMRIKRASYFKYATQDAVELARGLALKDMYPSDDVLLQRYRDFLNWQVYKYEVLSVALCNKRKPVDLNSSSKIRSGKPEVDSVTMLYEHNKATLHELDSILNNEEESITETNWKRFDEVNPRKQKETEMKKFDQSASITQATPSQGKSTVDRKVTLRRMSKILMASEFSPIVEAEEQD